MQVRCPDCRESIEVHSEDSFADMKCTACGTMFSLVGEETVEFRQDSPREIAHFRLQNRLGRGSFGTVWKAYDMALDRTVAVKLPRKGDFGHLEMEQFLREARASAQLRHENIVAVHEVGRHEDTAYLVMDYVEGPTLADQIAEGPWASREAAEMCVKVAEAVHYAHQSGVIHRDLKPSNILLNSRGEPHITDFGLAKRIADDVTLTVDGKILGTPAYMSPEQARGDTSKIDVRTDVYAIGVILYELLTGERPFRGNLGTLLTHVIESEPTGPRELNRHIPRDLETVCLKCLDKDPRRRYPTGAALAEDLRRFLDGEPVSARPTPALIRAERWCRRNLLAAGLAAGLLIVLTLGLTATAAQWSRAEKNAARETQLRIQVETLTEELLHLMEQIRQLETAQVTQTLKSTARKSAGRAARSDSVVIDEDQRAPAALGRPREDTRQAELAASQQRSLRGTTDGREGTSSGLYFGAESEAQAVAEISLLRDEAEKKLRELERLAPEIARQCRKLAE